MNTSILRMVSALGTLLLFVVSQGFAADAPITPEMLTTLRARGSADASRHHSSAIVTFKGDRLMTRDQITSIEFKENNASISTARMEMERVFGLPISAEGPPHLSDFGTAHKFDFKISANERLIDVMERLVKATDNQVRWRLQQGRLILTTTPREQEGLLPIGDRKVQVDIRADTYGDACLQLELAYNQMYADIPLRISMFSYDVAHMPANGADDFQVQGEYPLRNIIVDLLNQTGIYQSNYNLLPTVSAARSVMREYFFEHDLYYYHVAFFGLRENLDIERPDMWQPDLTPEEIEFFIIRDEWHTSYNRIETERLREYFDRIYPEWAAQEDAASDNDKAVEQRAE